MRQNMQTVRHAPGANTAALAASPTPPSEHRWRILFAAVAYGAAPTGGLLTIKSGSTVIWEVPIFAAGSVFFNFAPAGLQGGADEVVSVGGPAGGAGISGIANIAFVLE